jgi:hypothetical protein
MAFMESATITKATAYTARSLGWVSPVEIRAEVAIIAAGSAVVVEAAHFLLAVPPSLRIGQIPVSPSVLFALVAATLSGDRLLGLARSRAAAVSFWAVGLGSFALGMVIVTNEYASAFGLLMAGLNEELIYRYAAPALIAFGLSSAGIAHRRARTVGYVVASTAFVLLPGHVAQFNRWSDVVPFIAFAAVATMAVHRSGAVLEVGLLHGILNLINIGRISGQVGNAGGILLAAVTMLLLVAYIPPRPHRRLPDLDDETQAVATPDTDIDLRDHVLAPRHDGPGHQRPGQRLTLFSGSGGEGGSVDGADRGQ